MIYMKKNKKGFTLMELIAVIIVLGIIIGIVILLVRGASKKAKEKADDVFAESIRDIVDIYVDGNKLAYGFNDSTKWNRKCSVNVSELGERTLYKRNNPISIDEIINTADYGDLSEKDLINPVLNKTCSGVNVDIYKDDNGGSYYYFTLENCTTSTCPLTNLPDFYRNNQCVSYTTCIDSNIDSESKDSDFVPQFNEEFLVQNLITCSAGNYLPKDTTACKICKKNYYCEGGTFEKKDFDQGILPCPPNTYNDAKGESSIDSCKSLDTLGNGEIPSDNAGSLSDASFIVKIYPTNNSLYDSITKISGLEVSKITCIVDVSSIPADEYHFIFGTKKQGENSIDWESKQYKSTSSQYNVQYKPSSFNEIRDVYCKVSIVKDGKETEFKISENKVTVDTYKANITFKSGDDIIKTISVAYGESLNISNIPKETKEGYIVAGWYYKDKEVIHFSENNNYVISSNNIIN